LKAIATLGQVTYSNNCFFLNAIAKLDEATEKAIVAAHLASLAVENATSTVLESGAAMANRGWWVKIKEKAWEKLYDLVASVAVGT